MKKVLVLLASLAVLFTSCHKDDDVQPSVPDEVIFYNDFIALPAQIRQVGSIVDQYAQRYVDGVATPEMTVVANSDGSHTMTIDLDAVGGDYSYRGILTAKVTGTTFVSDDAVKTINVGQLKMMRDSYTSYRYSGLITVTNMPSSDPDERDQQVEVSDYKYGLEGDATNIIELTTYMYGYRHLGVSTSNVSDDSYYYEPYYNDLPSGSGKHYKYGNFSVNITSEIKSMPTLAYYTQGGYMFFIEKLGGNLSPVTADFCRDGDRTVTITANGVPTVYRVI